VVLSELNNHRFSRTVFETANPLIKTDYEYRKAHGREAEYPFDEFEFYILRVGNRLATLLYHCEQLEHSVLFLSNYRQTPSLSIAGINRTKYLRYSVENYIIRTQTLYDLVLKLIDSVFHLTNADSQCRDNTIVQNLKVKQSKIPSLLKPLRKKLREFEIERHVIIHRGGYQDKDLYHLELLTVVEDSYHKSDDEGDRENIKYLREDKKHFEKDYIRVMKAKFSRFNSRVFHLLIEILSELFEIYNKEQNRLTTLTGRSAQQ